MSTARSSAPPRGVAWDTSGHALVLAARGGARSVAFARHAGLAYHSERLFLTLEKTSRKAGLDLSRPDFVAAGRGPGSFTGVRVGVAAAKILAYATGAKLMLLSSLEIVAANLRAEKRRVCVIQDARRNRLFSATYQDGETIVPPHLVHTGDFLFRLEPDTVFVGDAVPMFAETIARKCGKSAVVRDRRSWSPQPARLMELALRHYARGRFGDPLDAVPEYLYEDTCNVTPPNPAKRQPR